MDFANLVPILLAIVGVIVIVGCILSAWKKVPSDKASVIVGIGEPKVVTGGGTIVIPLLQRMDTITLENIMFDVSINQTKTSLGVPINAEGVVVIKVKNDTESIKMAVQQFNCNSQDKTVATIKNLATEVCKGKLREIISSMSVEDIYSDREAFASRVQDVVATELGEMGLELKSFTINDITDDDQYIESLGKEQIAKVKSSASIAEAEAEKERKIKTAEADKIGRQAELIAQSQIAEAEKDKNLKVLTYEKESATQKAISDASYNIQEKKTKKEVINAEMDADLLKEQRNKEIEEAKIQVEIVAEQKKIELAQKKAERKEAELLEIEVKPAEANKRVQELKAEADKITSVKKAEAEAEAKKLDALAEAKAIEEKGRAEAEAIKLKGLSEAEALSKKAEALAKMNEAGKLQMVLEKLPEIASAIAKPMEKIGNITIIGGSDGGNSASDVTRMSLCALKAVTEGMKDTLGFDLSEVMRANTFEGKTTKNINIDVRGLPEGTIIDSNTVKTAVTAIESPEFVLSDTKNEE